MTRIDPIAGGFFLVIPIIAGFFIGLSRGDAMGGAIVGLGIGILLALLIWAVDQRRRR